MKKFRSILSNYVLKFGLMILPKDSHKSWLIGVGLPDIIIMDKEEFITRRTKIISKMLDNPNECWIYPTTQCFAELDDLYDELINSKRDPSWAQIYRNKSIKAAISI